MLEAAYGAMTAFAEAMVDNRRARRIAMLACFGLPFGLMVWNPPWFQEAYIGLAAPLLMLGFGLVILDMDDWEERRDAARKAAESPADASPGDIP